MPGKQFIYCGWDTPPTEPLPGVRSFSEQAPSIRGVDGYAVQAVRSGKPNNGINLAIPQTWHEEDFAGSTIGGWFLWARLLNPQNNPIDWTDNERWSQIGRNFRVLRDVADRLQCRGGILFDIEHYGTGQPLFKQRADDDLKWAFHRGYELAPYCPLSFHRLLSHLIDVVPPKGTSANFRLAEHKYGLLPEFVNGMVKGGLDLTDYCSTNLPKSAEEVYAQHAVIRNTLPDLVGVDYRSVRIGQSIRLDLYAGINGLDFPSMAQAYWDCSEVGLLLWGEKGGRLLEPNPHINKTPNPYPLWTEAIPEFSDTLVRVSDPARFATEYTSSHPNVLADWRFHRPPGSAVTQVGFDLIGQGEGSLYQRIPAEPGDRFAASCQVTPGSTAWLGARWQDKRGQWLSDGTHSRRFNPDESGRCAGVAVAPDGCSKMVPTLAVRHTGESDRTTFTEPRLAVVK